MRSSPRIPYTPLADRAAFRATIGGHRVTFPDVAAIIAPKNAATDIATKSSVCRDTAYPASTPSPMLTAEAVNRLVVISAVSPCNGSRPVCSTVLACGTCKLSSACHFPLVGLVNFADISRFNVYHVALNGRTRSRHQHDLRRRQSQVHVHVRVLEQSEILRKAV